MANHLEQLIYEWLEFKGYVVRRNVKVGKLVHGGHEGELDIVAYHPINNHLIQIEPSIDSVTWKKREQRFKKKFDAGRKHITSKIFPWLPRNKKVEKWAVLIASDKNNAEIGGGKVVPIWKLYRMIVKDINALGNPSSNAIPEIYPLLRTIQHTLRWARPIQNNGEDEQQ
jgi:hypothetical protein